MHESKNICFESACLYIILLEIFIYIIQAKAFARLKCIIIKMSKNCIKAVYFFVNQIYNVQSC